MRRNHFSPAVFIPLIFLIGCAGSYYTQGRQSLKRQEYDTAITQFRAALADYPGDPEILREMGIAYYEKSELDSAKLYLLKSFVKDTTDGRTLFYLGATFEQKQDIPHAIDIYKRFTQVSASESIRKDMEARLMVLVRQQVEMDIRNLVQQESSLDVNAIPDNSVAVLYFKNLGQNEKLNPIQKGLADMMITDFSKVKSLKVVERIRMQKLMEELGLGMTGLVDAATAPRVGKLLGASKMVNGGFLDLAGGDLRIEAGIVQTKDDKPIQTGKAQGRLLELFQLEKNLVFGVLNTMDVQLSQAERDDIQTIPTENLLAFMAYCQGLDSEDKGQYQEASGYYKQAADLDPNFQQAQQHYKAAQELELGSISIQDLEVQVAAGPSVTREVTPITQTASEETSESASLSTDMETPGMTAIEDFGSQSLVDQMIRTSTVLDQGFLPGIDSREPAQEQGESSFGNTANIEIRVPLPEPPNTR